MKVRVVNKDGRYEVHYQNSRDEWFSIAVVYVGYSHSYTTFIAAKDAAMRFVASKGVVVWEYDTDIVQQREG